MKLGGTFTQADDRIRNTVHGAPRLDSLTSLRFAAAFLVFGFHATTLLQEPSRQITAVLFGAGHAGVSFFFILSGFVLAWSFREDDTAKAFYRRRFARIYPAYLLSLCVAGLMVLLTSSPAQLFRGLFAPFMVQAWIPDSSYYFALNTVAWSLSVEAFFYLAFPLVANLLFRLSRRGRVAFASAMVGVILALGIYGQATLGGETFHEEGAAVWFVKTFPLARLPEFMLGILLAMQLRSGKFTDIGVNKAIAVAVIMCLAIGVFPSILGFVALPLIPFVLLIAAAAQSDLSGRSPWLRNLCLVNLGAWSYCFYLFHTMVIRILADGFYHLGYSSGEPIDEATQRLPLDGWPVWLAAMALSTLAAWLIHRYWELPMDKRLR